MCQTLEVACQIAAPELADLSLHRLHGSEPSKSAYGSLAVKLGDAGPQAAPNKTNRSPNKGLTRSTLSWKPVQGPSRLGGGRWGGPAGAKSAGEASLGEAEVREKLPSCRGVGETVAGSSQRIGASRG